MKLYLRGHSYRYAMEQIQLSLFPAERVEYVTEPFDEGDGAVSVLSEGAVYLTASAHITYRGQTASAQRRIQLKDATEPLRRQILRQSYYQAAIQLLGVQPPWGALSGVRPTKLTTRHLLAGGTPASADRLMRDTYYVSPSRRTMCVECSTASAAAAKLLAPQDISLYVGIPFCPTRCVYCSFVSQTTGKSGAMLADYLDALEQEIDAAAALIERAGLRVRTIYIGGGTPTTLSADQLARLMGRLHDRIDRSAVLEYTVEGGRPDTLDAEKLATIRAFGADRISINPQTMNNAVLRAIGRQHDAQMILDAYRDAREVGFHAINMDLIAGLPCDTPSSFADSLAQVISLEPENITVHTLALKKGAALFERRENLPPDEAVAEMVAGAEQSLRAAGYVPYYLYRQKYMSGSFENVGWTKPDCACLYNIYMMEELQSILSVGAGGMTKINLPGGKLVRFHNPKYPKEYIERIGDVCTQKKAQLDTLAGETT
jgi:oxygen-independent coproporphyrinogen-3 oxidase